MGTELTGFMATSDIIKEHLSQVEHGFSSSALGHDYDLSAVTFDLELLVLLGYLHHKDPQCYLIELETYLLDVIDGKNPAPFFIIETNRGHLGGYHRTLLNHVRAYREKYREELATADFSAVRKRDGFNSMGSSLAFAKEHVPTHPPLIALHLAKSFGNPSWILSSLGFFNLSKSIAP